MTCAPHGLSTPGSLSEHREAGAAYNDTALRIVTGAVATGGADAFSAHFGTGKATAGHTLTTAEMTPHAHTGNTGGSSETLWRQFGPSPQDINDVGPSADNTAGSAAHTHPIPSEGGGAAHDHVLNNMNIKFADVIIASKD